VHLLLGPLAAAGGLRLVGWFALGAHVYDALCLLLLFTSNFFYFQIFKLFHSSSEFSK
jgi:hypothetical protein